MAEVPTLYVCHGDDQGPRLHPCRRVQEALKDADFPNNPGFDLETSTKRFQFVEVKGTVKRLPTFFLSEGERRFGAENASTYLLAVVYGMDLSRETYEDIAWSRPPLEPGELLNPSQWWGRLPASAATGPSSLRLI
jgi:Domain of unknown function (DUF3883)